MPAPEPSLTCATSIATSEPQTEQAWLRTKLQCFCERHRLSRLGFFARRGGSMLRNPQGGLIKVEHGFHFAPVVWLHGA